VTGAGSLTVKYTTKAPRGTSAQIEARASERQTECGSGPETFEESAGAIEVLQLRLRDEELILSFCGKEFRLT